MTFQRTRLKERRKVARLTQAQLAEKNGVSLSKMYRWESGIGEPSGTAVYALSVTLNTAMEYFVGNIKTPDSVVPMSPDEGRLVANFRAIGKAGRQICIECLKDTRSIAEICARKRQ